MHLLLLDSNGAALRAAHSSDQGSAIVPLRTDANIVRFLASRTRAAEMPWHGAILSAAETAWLDALGVSLAVPIGGGARRLSGLLLLGEKKSEQPYSTEDRALLEAVASDLPYESGDEVALMINGLGGTPISELYILYGRAHRGPGVAGQPVSQHQRSTEDVHDRVPDRSCRS